MIGALPGAESATPKYASLAILITLGWLILRNSKQGRSSENLEITLYKRIFAFVREISTYKVVSLTLSGRRYLNLYKPLSVEVCTPPA